MARVIAGWSGVVWLIALAAAGPVSAQPCGGIDVEVGRRERRCLVPGAAQPFKDCPDCPELVVVPAGSFTMGAPPDEHVATDREDQVRVRIARPFAVGRFAVTLGEFAAFVQATGRRIDGRCRDLLRRRPKTTES